MEKKRPLLPTPLFLLGDYNAYKLQLASNRVAIIISIIIEFETPTYKLHHNTIMDISKLKVITCLT